MVFSVATTVHGNEIFHSMVILIVIGVMYEDYQEVNFLKAVLAYVRARTVLGKEDFPIEPFTLSHPSSFQAFYEWHPCP